VPLRSTGVPLAVLPDDAFPAAPAVLLEPGETVVLLTDGIVEAHGPGKILFGIDRTLDLVRAHRQKSSREIVDTLYGEVRKFRGEGAQLDDMTAIIIRVI
jgi:serine phosphatase RsbU (regulator of sigma subunit)